MNLFDLDVMNLRLSRRQPLKDFRRPSSSSWRQIRPLDAPQNNRKPTMMMLLPALHLHIRRKNRPALHLLSRDTPTLKPEPPQPQFDLAQFRPRIHQGAQHHVPADARKTVEIGDTRAVHEFTAKFIAASRKNDTILPSKSCQIPPLRHPAHARPLHPNGSALRPVATAYCFAIWLIRLDIWLLPS